MIQLKDNHFAALIGVAALLTVPDAYANGSIQAIPYLPGDLSSQALGVSSSGQYAVGYSTSTPWDYQNDYHAFRWSQATGVIPLGELPGAAEYSVGRAVSDDGLLVVGYSNADPYMQGFRWTPETGMVGLGVPGDPGFLAANQVLDMTSDGSTMVGWVNTAPGESEAAYWTADTGWVSMGKAGPNDSLGRAVAISEHGQTIVGYTLGGSFQPFRWTAEEGMVQLGTLPGDNYGFAYGVSPNGKVIMGQTSSATGGGGYYWTAEQGMVALGPMPDTENKVLARDSSYDGSIIIGRGFTDAGQLEPIIWDQTNGVRLLADVLTGAGVDLSGWTRLEQADAISYDGQTIVGNGWRNGYRQAYMIKLNRAAETRDYSPTLDARAAWNGASFDVSDGDLSLVAQRIDFADIDRRAIMEFDVSDAPYGAYVHSATLQINVGFFTTGENNGEVQNATLQLLGYAGDGSLSADDATAGSVFLGQSAAITDTGLLEIDLDPVALTELIQGGAEYLGLLGISGPFGKQIGFDTTEAELAFPTLYSAPGLEIVYDWPTVMTGDLDGDWQVTNADISALVLALTDPDAYSEAYPFIDPDLIADFTGDGTMTNADIAGFVELLTGGASPEAAALEQQILAQVNAVPEPGSLALLAIGGLLLSRRRRCGHGEKVTPSLLL